jgi:Spy/CpxP family protein refolding chaperone
MTTVLVLTTFAAGAQTQTPPPDAAAPAAGQHRHIPNADEQLRRMTKRLNLTDAQQQQLRPILAERDQQVLAIQNDTTLSPQQQHQSMAKLMHDTNSQITNVLTDAQRQQWEQAREQMREHRHGAPSSQPAPATQPPPSV